MTQQHSVTPPPELLKQWEDDWFDERENVDVLLTQAFQAGADQELEACCEWLKVKHWVEPEFADELRAARRPKPPSLAEQALTLLDDASTRLDAAHENTIRRALERLQELEGTNG